MGFGLIINPKNPQCWINTEFIKFIQIKLISFLKNKNLKHVKAKTKGSI